MDCYDREGKFIGRYETFDHDKIRVIQSLPLDYEKHPTENGGSWRNLHGRPLDMIDYCMALEAACRMMHPNNREAAWFCQQSFLQEAALKRNQNPLSLS